MDKRRVCITVVLMLLGTGIYIFSRLHAGKTVPVVTVSGTSASETSELTEISPPSVFPVYICGAVNRPGIYETDRPVYLYELVEMAGGLTETADEKHIDLVYLVGSSQSIYIPFLEDYEKAEVTELFVPANENTSANSREETAGRIDINSADISLLATLPGIGEKTAQKIVNYRETNGRFATKEDIMNVPGIGESKYEAIKDLILAG